MAIKISELVRNARLDAIETIINTGAVLKIRSGAPPAAIADADSGDELAVLSLDADWMNAASGGSKTKKGTWAAAATDDGVAGHFRIYATDGVTQHMQGTCGMVGTEDMVLDNSNIATGQIVTISTFTLTDGNA